MPNPEPLLLSEVIERGKPLIERIAADLRSAVADALREPASWHPTGFIVINLLDVEGLGLVRLHLWPRARRQKRVGNPEVHVHVFHLTSYVLEGTYVEHQFRKHESDEGDLRGYSVVPPNGDGIDKLAPDGERYSLELLSTEVTQKGSFHHLPAGIYHLTDNAEGETCATIALISRPQPGYVDHLIGPEDHEGLESRRSYVEDDDLKQALEEVGLVGLDYQY